MDEKQPSRAEILESLGFKSYAEYLKSDLWEKVRAKVFALKGRVCCCCGKKAWYIHHTAYSLKTLSGDTNALIAAAYPVCGKCHKSVHFRRNGEFRNGRAARDSFADRSAAVKKKVANKRGMKIGRRRKLMEDMAADKAFHDRMCGK